MTKKEYIDNIIHYGLNHNNNTFVVGIQDVRNKNHEFYLILDFYKGHSDLYMNLCNLFDNKLFCDLLKWKIIAISPIRKGLPSSEIKKVVRANLIDDNYYKNCKNNRPKTHK